MSEKLQEYLEVPQQFVREGNQFITRCTKPTQKEFIQICRAVAIGFVFMGFLGYFVKLIHIPINNILVGGA
ncbi:Sec61p translocation complex subunit [Tulasnella sp. 418]|nr:Sec61p translocation complex subunit [Tulasnella sp. 418]